MPQRVPIPAYAAAGTGPRTVLFLHGIGGNRGSFAADPNGNLLAKAGHSEETTLVVECDLERIDAVRTHWPFLRDRRIDAYGDLTKRFLDR